MKIKGYLIIFCSIILGGCLTPELVQGPDGSWYETGRKVAYPDIEVLRGKKSLNFPLKLQIQLISYRKEFGAWPYSLEGFLDNAKENREEVQSLYNQGFSNFLFVQNADTLLLYFHFSKQLKIRHSEVDEGYIKTNLIPGVWKFYPLADGKIVAKEELYVDY